MEELTKATDLRKIGRYVTPHPLDESTWHMWVDTQRARGANSVGMLIEQFRQAYDTPDPIHALFGGHRGCGKSTELYRVKEQLEEEGLYHVVIARVSDQYPLATLDYRLLLFFCASQLIKVASDIDADLSPAEAATVMDWFDEQTINEVKESGYEAEAGAGGGINLLFLRLLSVNVNGKIYSGGATQETVSRYIESRLDQLRLNMKVIVRAIERKLDGPRLLLVLEDLDKIEDREQGRRLFFEHRLQLRDVPCNVILTFPIALWYDPEGGVQLWDIRYLLPMIPVAASEDGHGHDIPGLGEKAELGRQTIRQAVFARLDKASGLITDEALDRLIDCSGGVLRDVLYLLREAAITARVSDRERVELADVEAAARRLRQDYSNRLAPREDENNPVTLREIFGTLGASTDWPKRFVDYDAALQMLLQSLCILEYNGEGWYDLHPLVHEYLRMREQQSPAAA